MENISTITPMQSAKNERKVDFVPRKLPPIDDRRGINYEKLLLLSKEVEEREKVSREDAHQTFMNNYHSIFQQDPKSYTNVHERLAEKQQRISKPPPKKDESHNIADHLLKLRKNRSSPSKDARMEELMKKVRRSSKKLPHERSSKENYQLFKSLLSVNCLSHVPKKVLEKLVSSAHLEKWDPHFTVFGDSGLYLIVKGSCIPNEPYRLNQSPMLSRMESSLSPDYTIDSSTLRKASMLHPGDHFGQLETINDEDNSSIKSVVTLEECELLRFSSTFFDRVTKQIKDEEYGNKLHLAQNCKLFHEWPNHALKKISEVFQWVEVPAGEVLGLEGTVAQRVCVIKEGSCLLRKVLSVLSTNHDGKKVKKSKEVITGILEPGDSFGEKSLTTNEPLEYSIISETYLVMATVSIDDIEGLDDVTKALFQQTCKTKGSKMSEGTVKTKYIEKQAELEWKLKKDKILREALYYNGIMPGYSKWSQNPTMQDVQHFQDIK